MRRAHQTIHTLIRSTLPQFGVAEDTPWTETVWTCPGRFHCHRFELETIRAVWFVEAGELKFYRKDRRVLKTVRLDQLHSGSGAISRAG